MFKLKKLFRNIKGSEVVEKMMMVIASVTLFAVGIGFMNKFINSAIENQIGENPPQIELPNGNASGNIGGNTGGQGGTVTPKPEEISILTEEEIKGEWSFAMKLNFEGFDPKGYFLNIDFPEVGTVKLKMTHSKNDTEGNCLIYDLTLVDNPSISGTEQVYSDKEGWRFYDDWHISILGVDKETNMASFSKWLVINALKFEKEEITTTTQLQEYTNYCFFTYKNEQYAFKDNWRQKQKNAKVLKFNEANATFSEYSQIDENKIKQIFFEQKGINLADIKYVNPIFSRHSQQNKFVFVNEKMYFLIKIKTTFSENDVYIIETDLKFENFKILDYKTSHPYSVNVELFEYNSELYIYEKEFGTKNHILRKYNNKITILWSKNFNQLYFPEKVFALNDVLYGIPQLVDHSLNNTFYRWSLKNGEPIEELTIENSNNLSIYSSLEIDRTNNTIYIQTGGTLNIICLKDNKTYSLIQEVFDEVNNSCIINNTVYFFGYTKNGTYINSILKTKYIDFSFKKSKQ